MLTMKGVWSSILPAVTTGNQESRYVESGSAPRLEPWDVPTPLLDFHPTISPRGPFLLAAAGCPSHNNGVNYVSKIWHYVTADFCQ
jgi:hypothetical protein